jgi:hypothetical protein
MGFGPSSDGVTGAAPAPGPGPGLSVLARSVGFGLDGLWDKSAPSASLALALEEAAGPDFSCPGASHDEKAGIVRQWAALESLAAAGRLGALRSMAADEEGPAPGGFSKALAREVALALSVSAPTAESMLSLAQDLRDRLPGIGRLLADGTLTCPKARAVNDALALLSPEDAAKAEALILDQLAGKNFGQAQKLAEQAAVTVDPEAAARRREDAEKEKARVELFREQSGAAGLSGRDLPTGQALAADANVSTRAMEYKASGAFPGVRLGRLRAAAYLDLINGITADDRIASGVLPGDDPAPDDPAEDGPTAGSPGPDDGPGGAGPAAPGPTRGNPGAARPRLPDLILPLATLLGLAERPGEGYGFGPLDPGLCRALAEAAAASPHSAWCVTIVDEHGIAIGHGCAKPPRTRPAPAANTNSPLTARINLTIPAAHLDDLARQAGPPGQATWSFTRERDPGPPGGYGRWTITRPTGQQLAVALEPMPTFGCDHRHESHAYQPNDTLRHLVQVRDYECTFPQCSRHARDSDFEHAVPYDKGGRTCACNAGARSRACHQVKQSKGWTVTQPKPGWHQWTTPAGRTYTKGPKHYPA